MNSPEQLLRLAVRHHRTPWNWLVHAMALLLLACALLFHSRSFFVLFMGLLAAGFLNLHLPEMREGRFRRFAESCIAAEIRFSLHPSGWKKRGLQLTIAAAFLLSCWALWTQAILLIVLLAGAAVLVKVAMDNKACGIDP